MATAIKSKRHCDGNENEDEPQETKKKRKISENDVYQKQQKAIDLCKEKKPYLSASVFGEDCEISYDQLYEFLKYSMLGKQHGAAQSSWCRIHHRRRLSGVVVVVLHEVSQLHYYLFYLQFKFLRKIFRHIFQRGKQGHDDYSHFVHTHCSGPVTDSSPLFGLDCEMKTECWSRSTSISQDFPSGKPDYPINLAISALFLFELFLVIVLVVMCLTDKGSELTRISVVDASGQCILDELVKPKLPIINYLTSYSGITEKLLLPVVTTLSDIQDRLKSLLPANAVLVGHSLNFDLQALEMVHPNVIDTSLLFARKGGKRFKLKFLAEAVLGKEIQCLDGRGHDPTEDARCALELAQYFIKQGPRKACDIGSRDEPRRPIARAKEDERGAELLLDSLHFAGRKTLLLGGEAASNNCQNETGPQNKQVLQRAQEEVPESSFSVIQFALDSRHVTSDLIAKMQTKLASLLTVYAGPFSKDVCMRSLKKTFKKYGHIQSIRIIPETSKPHICIQYEVLEAAQLAIDSLNGAEVGGSPIKVQRPITETMLDCEMLVKELEKDADNEGVIYLTGLRKTQRETDLQQELGYLNGLTSVFLPRDPRTGRRRNYCFLKFQTPESAANALLTIEKQTAQGSNLHGRWALTPPHFYQWASCINQNDSRLRAPPSCHEACLQEKQPPLALEEELKKEMKVFDRRIKKIYQCLPNHTLCIILLPGTSR
ncbi:hypothetical protein JD844_019812 [Phrynosoma platyrhinos]|uniref:RRM domain-containing protein n=1 Tax=Phrynosoma platyrhinos TaxID=52577 RepID=A0ABQ7TRH3_PHRPL|nr:hypothetical protein JD844_019812 [Phrynosoma platyrhinos]